MALLNCPRCAVPMRDVLPDEADFPSLQALGCERCGGHWLEERALHQLERVVDVKWIELRQLPGPHTQQVALTCPRCAPPQTLLKLKNDRDRKVVMDACGVCHGIWLDAGELRAIQEQSAWSAVADALRFLLE